MARGNDGNEPKFTNGACVILIMDGVRSVPTTVKS